MRPGQLVATILALTTVIALGSGCEDPGPKTPGTVVVSFKTIPGDESPFVWVMAIPGAGSHDVSSTDSGTVTFVGVPAGERHLTVGSLPGVCTSGTDDRLVEVPSADTLRVSLQVKCTRVTGDVALVVATSGVEHDPDGYTVMIDGVAGAFVPAQSSAQKLLPKIAPGVHVVTLSGLESNCTVQTNPQPNVTVVAGVATPFLINVVCVTTLATLRIVTNTNSVATADPDGYLASVGTTNNIPLPNSGTTDVVRVAGTYTITVGDVEPSCTIANPTETVSVAKSSIVTITFNVTCGAYPTTVAGVTVTDPLNDTLPNTFNGTGVKQDIVSVSTRYGPGFMIVSFKVSQPITAPFTGFVDFDLDEEVGTGVPPVMNQFGGSASQGVDARIQFQTQSQAFIATTTPGIPTRLVRMLLAGDSIQFYVPFVKVSDDGSMTVTAIIGPNDRPTDLVPNTGVIVTHVPAAVAAQNSLLDYRRGGAATDARAVLSNRAPVGWVRRPR